MADCELGRNKKRLPLLWALCRIRSADKITVIIKNNVPSKSSSNSGRSCLLFTSSKYLLEKYVSHYYYHQVATDNTDFPISFSPSIPIIHRSRLVFQTTSSVRTKLTQISSYLSATMCRESIEEGYL